MKTKRSAYAGYRFPPEVIRHCVWVYFRFSLSYRDVEEMMAERGIIVTYETIRAWCEKFGRDYAKRIRMRRGRLGDVWHLDEVYLRINGHMQYLWRAVDQDGSVLDILVQSKRDKKAAGRFFRKLLRGLRYAPRVVVTDKLRSYDAPCVTLLPSARHLRGKGQNNRAENSHQRLENESGACEVSSRASMRGAFCPCLGLSSIYFARVVICFRRETIAKRWVGASANGEKSPGPLLPVLRKNPIR